MHVADFSRGILGANGIVGGGVGLAVGAALAAQLDGKRRVSVVFFGDGGANQGVVMEAINLAVLWKLPLLLVCENNGFSEFSSTQSVTSGEIAARAQPYGAHSVVVDGNDVQLVYVAAQDALERARSGAGPTLIEARTYRWRGHVETEKSFLSSAYRTDEEIALWVERDPIARAHAQLLESGVPSERVTSVQKEIEEIVERSYAQAMADPLPAESTAFEDMLA